MYINIIFIHKTPFTYNYTQMIDKLILEKAELISYNRLEISNIASSSNHLRSIINNQPDFRSSFIGGSYKRKTMVKNYKRC